MKKNFLAIAFVALLVLGTGYFLFLGTGNKSVSDLATENLQNHLNQANTAIPSPALNIDSTAGSENQLSVEKNSPQQKVQQPEILQRPTQEITVIGDFFSPITIDENTQNLFASDLQVDPKLINAIDVDYQRLAGYAENDVFAFSYEETIIELYVNAVTEKDGVKSVMGNLSNADRGFYFGLSFDSAAKAVDGMFMTDTGVYEVHTLYGTTVILRAPERKPH